MNSGRLFGTGGMWALNLTKSDLVELPKGDKAKCVLAWLAHTSELVNESETLSCFI